jgi:phosphatidylglycerol:prolipoprotein diacylglycerol transferase
MFSLFGLSVHLYGLLIGIGIGVAVEVALARKKSPIDRKNLERVIVWAVISGITGARVYHVIDFWSRYYSLNPIKIFFVWEGGLGIWGAILGGALGTYIYCLFKKQDFISTLDDLIVGMPLAQAIGRLGNYVNGELYGENGEPLFFYEAILNLILFGVLWKTSKTTRKPGILTGIYLMGYGVIRILLEGLRPEGIIWRIYGVPTAVLLGVIAILVGVYLYRFPVGAGNDNTEFCK